MMRTIEELGDELCNYCPIPKEYQGIHLGPNGPYGCEGSHCGEAYENYLEKSEEDEE